ncbi:MAG: alpha amylase C-terminal domain-containing protein, partial [Clostridia bacterium]|nr:alpha amylase C-terminal domain-containing protein [Clostridia bacterium]
VHGKRSLLDKMYGTYEEKFMQLKAYYAYMMAHPGKKLLFMGGEFGQFIEWRPAEGLDWNLHEYDTHDGLLRFVQFLNETYKNEKSFWQIEDSWDDFKWINAGDENNSVLSFVRYAKAKTNHVVVISSFTPVARQNYRIGVPSGGEYEIILNSDDQRFGGSSTFATVKADNKPWGEFKHSLALDLPPFTTLYLKRKRATKKKES